MGGAFLHKKSLLDQFKDDYAMTDPIKARRAERSWGDPIVRHKREKGIQDWAKSFAGKRHYRKLMRFNAMRSEAYTEKTAWAYLEELEKLEGEESRMEATEKVLRAAGCEPGTEGRWYDKDGDEVDIIDVLDNTEWAFAQKVCGQLQESKGTDEKLSYEKGNKNSRGEDAPWVIRDHEGGKVLASFAKKADAEAHLERMQRYSKNEAASHIVADNRLGKIVKARQRDNVLAFLPIDDDGKNDDCTYFFKVDGDDIITKGYHWDRDKIDRSMIADDGYPWTAEPNRPTPDYVHTKKYATYLLDRVRKCLDLGVATQKSESLKKALHESRAKKLERMGEAADAITSRGVQAAARSAWSSSGAKDFKLDIVRLGDHVIIYAKGPNGEDNIGIDWHVHIPSELNSYKTPHVEQFADWRDHVPERTYDAKDLDDLEDFLLSEFKALQEALDEA